MTHTWVLLHVDARVAVGPGGPRTLDGRIICMVVLPQPFSRIARSASQVLHPLHNVLTRVHMGWYVLLTPIYCNGMYNSKLRQNWDLNRFEVCKNPSLYCGSLIMLSVHNGFFWLMYVNLSHRFLPTLRVSAINKCLYYIHLSFSLSLPLNYRDASKRRKCLYTHTSEVPFTQEWKKKTLDQLIFWSPWKKKINK